MRCQPKFLAAITLLLTGFAPAKADLITWGGGLGNLFQNSSGGDLGSSFIFELGTFDSFTPTATNVDSWSANWHVFDRATTTGVGDAPQWDPTVPLLLGSAIISAGGQTNKTAGLALPDTDPLYIDINAAYDFRGKSVMLWALNDRRTNVGAEWGLYTGTFAGSNNPWAFPTSVAADCGCALGADFNLADISSSVIGTFSQSTPDDTTSTLLTLAVVPEPGGAILILAAGMLFLVKRRRHAAP